MRHDYDPDGWPTVSAEDWRALFGLLCFIGIIIALCAVDPTGMAAPR